MAKTIDEILLKAPFKRMLPIQDWTLTLTSGGDQPVSTIPNNYILVPQYVFLSEYDPAGHKINDPHYYADRLKTDDRTTPPRTYIHYVERVALPWQQVITTKQLTHLSGNYIKFVDSNPNPTDAQKILLTEFKQGWINKNMEVAMYQSFEMEKITGDTAFCGYMDKGKFGWRTFGYMNGEVLYPHYDRKTGKLNLFGRRYDQVGDGKTQNMLDVWDDTYMTTYRKDSSVIGKAKKIVGISDGWVEEYREAHGFKDSLGNGRIPIAYKRNDFGACWSPDQDLIDKIEIAVSQLCENNKAYAFRILFVKAEDEGSIETSTVDQSGNPAVIRGSADSDAKFLEGADASTSFKLQLEILEKYILMGSFTVLPPEVRGGDLPGVTIKLLYSPAVEKAMEDAIHWNSFVDDVVSIFKIGFGVETKKTTDFNTLQVRGEIIPYVHQNEMEQATILNQGYTMGTISRETASAQYPGAASDENERLKKESIEDQSAQIQSELNQNNQNRQNAGI